MSIIKNNYLKAFKINSGMMLEINRRLLQKLKNEGIIIKFKVYNHPKKIFNYNNKVFIDDKIKRYNRLIFLQYYNHMIKKVIRNLSHIIKKNKLNKLSMRYIIIKNDYRIGIVYNN